MEAWNPQAEWDFAVSDPWGFADDIHFHVCHRDHYGTDPPLDYPERVLETRFVVGRNQANGSGVDTGLEVNGYGHHVIAPQPDLQPNYCWRAWEAEVGGQSHRHHHHHYQPACSTIEEQLPIDREERLEPPTAGSVERELEHPDLEEQDFGALPAVLVEEEKQQVDWVRWQDFDFVHHYSNRRTELQAGLQLAHRRQ